MKRIQLIIILAYILIMAGCKKDDNLVDSTASNQDPSITSISGRIKNWTLGKDYKLELGWRPYVYAVAKIDSLGNFSFPSLPNVPTNELDNSVLQGVSRSDPTIKSTGFYFLLVYSPNSQSSDYHYGQIVFQNSSSQEAYLYADKTSTFSGDYQESGLTNTCIFLVKPGWNRITFTTLSKTSGSINNSIVVGGEWVFSQQ